MTMSPHQGRPRGRRKKVTALGDFIRRDVERLRFLAEVLNGNEPPQHMERLTLLVGEEPLATRWASVEPLQSRQEAVRNPALIAATTAVVEAVLGTPYPDVPREAARRFNALADRASLRFVVDATGEIRPGDDEFRFAFSDQEHLNWVYLHTPTAEGVWVGWLALLFLENPQRERLHRCPMCQRWFGDETRNKSARRCSRACTIAWSNRQRKRVKPKKGGRR